jgi:hypothetical protein
MFCIFQFDNLGKQSHFGLALFVTFKRRVTKTLRSALTTCAVLLLLGTATLPIIGCKTGDENGPTSSATVDPFGDPPYDIAVNGIPKFVNVDYIELDKITRISKFRSAIGHDYSDDFETCRSMKHYYEPKGAVDWSSVKIYSPIDATLIFIHEGSLGPRLTLKSKQYPAFFVSIFHVVLATPLKPGDAVSAGQYLGNHFGSQMYSDIEVGVHTPTDGPNNVSPQGWKLISYFEVMTDELFQKYQARGMRLRSDAMIPKEARDSDTLDCAGETFKSPGKLVNWVTLN